MLSISIPLKSLSPFNVLWSSGCLVIRVEIGRYQGESEEKVCGQHYPFLIELTAALLHWRRRRKLMMIVIAIVMIAMLVKMIKFKLKSKLKNDDIVKEDDGDEKRNLH